MRRYNETREKIFGAPSKKIVKTRERYKSRKLEKFRIDEARLYEGTDTRIYAQVEINSNKIDGLLDSGATVCCIGLNCLDLVEELQLAIYPYSSLISTADGRLNQIIGRVKASITFNHVVKEFMFYLVPSLKQRLYLGVDFMKGFDLIRLHIDSISTNSISLVDENEPLPYPRMHALPSDQQQQLEHVIAKFPCFSKRGLGKTHLEEHSIDTRDAVPIKEKHYPVSPAVQKLMYAELDRMISLGVIEPSDSPWNNRVAFVRKGDKCRLCLDARRLNALTVKDAYPLPNIEGLLSRLGDTYYISSIDLKDAFWQLPLERSSREKTAFTIPGRPLYQFTVMPFGLCNAAQRLCRLMDKVIPSRVRESVFVYLDDLLVVSATFSEHLRLLEEVAGFLEKAGLTINVGKSKFCCKELKYLGYIVGEGKLHPDPEKVSAIEKYSYPKTPKQVRSFMGATGWYRRFIKDYALIAAPIFDTLKKKKVFEFTDEAKIAFENLKAALISGPVLIHPNFNKDFFVQCDASDVGMGAVLFQKDENDEERPVAYFSQKFTSAQKNYSVTERECLAVVAAIKKFRPYIEMMPFTVITDHSSLKWLMTQKDLSGRLARWSLQLQSFNFEVQHRKGKLNVVPDILSRYDLEEICMHTQQLIDLESPAFKDDDYKEIINKIEELKESLPDLKSCNGYVYKRTIPYDGTEMEDFAWKLWVPAALTNNIIKNLHESLEAGHGGIGKTIKRAREYFYWPNMNAQIREFVNQCQDCKENKPANVTLRPPMTTEPQVHRPFQKIYIDFLGPYPRSKKGNSYILIVLDALTKFVLLKAAAKANSKNTINFLISEVFHKFGCPETIVSDNGSHFISKDFAEMVKTFGIYHMRTAQYSPQANASERVNQSILAAIRTFLQTDQTEWDVYLSEIECALRSSVHKSIGMTPYFALFGVNMATHASAYKIMRNLELIDDYETAVLPKNDKHDLTRLRIRENLQKSFEQHAKTYNIRSRAVQFQPGQEIYRRNFQLSDFSKQRNAKLGKKFVKCRILKSVGKNLYELEDMQGKAIGIYHAKDLKQ